jgi:hypothetical protein
VCFCLSTLQLFYLEAVLSTKGYRYWPLISWRLQASGGCTGAWVAIWHHLHQPQLFIPLPMKQWNWVFSLSFHR